MCPSRSSRLPQFVSPEHALLRDVDRFLTAQANCDNGSGEAAEQAQVQGLVEHFLQSNGHATTSFTAAQEAYNVAYALQVLVRACAGAVALGDGTAVLGEKSLDVASALVSVFDGVKGKGRAETKTPKKKRGGGSGGSATPKQSTAKKAKAEKT
jgi:hypothetical protein